MARPTIVAWDGPLGATVTGVDLEVGLAPDIAAPVVQALAVHRVVTIADQRPSDAAYARFGRLWGDPIEFFNPRDRDTAYPEVIRISNAVSTPERLRDGAMHWHQDSSYEAVPAAVTMLSAVEAPDGRNETMFADLTAAYDALPVAQQEHLCTLRVVHDRRGCSPELMFAEERRGAATRDEPVPTVTHPLVVRHPLTGRLALYGVSGTPVGIEGMEQHAAIELLVGLKRHALQHQFRQTATAEVGTVLIWDNLAVMHCATATEYSDEDGHRRIIRRISTKRGTDE